MADTNLGAVIGDDLVVEERTPGGDVPEEEKQQKKKKRHRDREADARDRKRRSRDGSRSDDEKHHRKREKKSGDSESAYVDRAARGAGAAGAVQDTRDSIGGRRSDRDRDRDRRRSGSRERHRDKDRGRRERSGSRRRKRSSSPVRGRRRSSRSPSVGRRDRPRSSGHGRSRSVDRRQRDNRGRSRSPHARRNEQSRSEDKKGSKKGKNPSPERTLPTLKEILTNNPGISVTDAIQRLNMLNMQMQQAAFMGGGGAPTAPLTGVSVLGPAGALTKQQREIYVGNLPPGVSVPQITDFVNVAMRKLGVAPTALVGSVVSAWVSSDGHYAFVELRTIDEANTAMAYLSGLQIGPFALKVGRPKGLGPSGLTVPMAATPFTAHVLGLGPPPGGIPSLGGFPMPPITTSAVELGGLAKAFGSSIPGMAEGDSGNEPISNAVMAMNIPLSLTEHQIKELMSPFGPIVRFNLIADALGVAKSHTAVIEYDTSGAADAAVSGLSGIALGDSKLVLQRVPQSMALLLLQPAASKSQKIADGPSNPLLKLKPTAALQLSNMVSADDLRDDELFEELMEDVADECNSHGTVRSIVIPRPADDATDTKDFSSRDKDSGVGKIFVLFVDSAGAEKTLAAVNGRTFNGNIVEAVYYPVALLSRKVYKLPPDFDPEAEESLGISYKPIELEPVD